jgi:hypothetical protein
MLGGNYLASERTSFMQTLLVRRLLLSIVILVAAWALTYLLLDRGTVSAGEVLPPAIIEHPLP